MNGYTYLTFEQRREIERLHNSGVRTVEIAEHIGRSVAAVYEELKRGHGRAERKQTEEVQRGAGANGFSRQYRPARKPPRRR